MVFEISPNVLSKTTIATNIALTLRVSGDNKSLILSRGITTHREEHTHIDLYNGNYIGIPMEMILTILGNRKEFNIKDLNIKAFKGDIVFSVKTKKEV
jgi:hypothetical protein